MWSIDNAASTSEFPSGKSITLKVPASAGFPLKLSYKAAFSTSVTLTDDVVTTTGLPLSSHDIPPLGATIRLNFGRDIKRSFLTRQPEPRRQEEVPPGSAQQSIQTITRWYYDAIDRERKLLNRLYPPQVG
jgi:hypothetical protein